MELHFGQQQPYNIEYFGDNWLRPTIDEFPHYLFLEGNEEEYFRYLDLSWRNYEYTPSVHEEKKQQKVAQFRALIDDIKNSGKIKEPVPYTIALDGKALLVDGNHRAAIAKYYGLELPLQEISLEERLQKLTSVELRYGSGEVGIPYQPIIYKGEILVKGRRKDSLKRFHLIKKQDIYGKKVVDFGSNFGTNSVWAHEQGASLVVGMEKEKLLCEAAMRVTALLGYPIVTIPTDLSKPISFKTEFDTGFCFSIDLHVKNNEALSQNIADSGVTVLYFEAHDFRDIPKLIADKFEDCEFIGKTFKNQRPFYRLTRSKKVQHESSLQYVWNEIKGKIAALKKTAAA